MVRPNSRAADNSVCTEQSRIRPSWGGTLTRVTWEKDATLNLARVTTWSECCRTFSSTKKSDCIKLDFYCALLSVWQSTVLSYLHIVQNDVMERKGFYVLRKMTQLQYNCKKIHDDSCKSCLCGAASARIFVLLLLFMKFFKYLSPRDVSYLLTSFALPHMIYTYIYTIIPKLSSVIFAIRTLKPFLPQDSLRMIYYSYFRSIMTWTDFLANFTL
jgi:hypothetical protein